ncbi:MAG: hypothetical protein IPL19_07155 [Sandaracinaceae bacterium]|jgi:hypothetical protein|nr:hypothetical protein [Sandaracinaceae bacterium]
MTISKRAFPRSMGSRLALGCAVGVALSACGGGGEGMVEARVYGEEFIEEGIPASDLADGWDIQFSRFDVTVTGVTIAGVDLADGVTLDISAASGGEGQALTEGLVPTGRHDGSSFVIGRVEIEGTATKGAESRSFDWVFDEATLYENCETETHVTTGTPGAFQVTVHADHLFYDSLVSEEPELRFDALAAADTDMDDQITEAELAAAGVGSYDVGNEDVDDLWSWLVAHSRTLGHVDGEGHCDASPVAP